MIMLGIIFSLLCIWFNVLHFWEINQEMIKSTDKEQNRQEFGLHAAGVRKRAKGQREGFTVCACEIVGVWVLRS